MKIKLFNVRAEEASIAENWALKNNVEVDISNKPLNVETVSEVEGFDAVSNSQIGPLDSAVYPLLKQYGIKQIAQRSAGFDMYDLALAKENNIIISNVPSYSPESIAEFTVTICLMLIRQVELIRDRVNAQNFTWNLPIRGRVLGDMTVAIIGTGRIGQAAAKIFKGFGCRVVGYDVYQNDSLHDLLEYKESIEEAVKDADVVSLHMPAFESNYHQFDANMFNHFKKGAILMNMARGALVDTQALLDALDNDILSGAGIDTYEFEAPYVPKDWTGKVIEDVLFQRLVAHPKIIYTPHTAYYTDEAVKNLVETALDAAVEVVQTGDTKFKVN